jgi:hypothetical protein
MWSPDTELNEIQLDHLATGRVLLVCKFTRKCVIKSFGILYRFHQTVAKAIHWDQLPAEVGVEKYFFA